jgi:hypothetical protein
MIQQSNRYLTKSRFKEGLECFTKLYYTRKTNEYANQSLDDPFLKALANGGFQVGELAKFLFCDNPVEEKITIDTLNYEEALQETNSRLNSHSNKKIIAEAAFKHNNLFIRADIVVIEGKTINLYEVKAKSTSSEDGLETYLSNYNKPKEKIRSNWISYLYDLAFQKYVISKALPDYKVNAYMIMPNKDKTTSIEGLNQLFQIDKSSGQTKIIIPKGLKREELGNSILEIVNFDDIVDKIWHTYEVPTTLPGKYNFETFINLCEEKYVEDERIFAPITTNCKKCSYYKKANENNSLKSGFIECWKNATNYSEELLNKDLVIDLWNQNVDKFIKEGVYLLGSINPESISETKSKNAIIEINNGLSSSDRKKMQATKAKQNDSSYYFDKTGFDDEMKQWKYPFHMIDFETSTVSLPFHKNKRPYQGIAFQFSHHIIHENGNIEHANQFIHFEKGVYPNLEFIKALKKSLSNDDGTIFRYHNHENNYLNMIYRQIEIGEIEVEENEKLDLLNFIKSVTNDGSRAMVDLYKVVSSYYYEPLTKGKNGLKYILPAIIYNSDYLRAKYSCKGIYGKDLAIKSLNFDDQKWIDAAHQNDPYKTLPKILENQIGDNIDKLEIDIDGISDGGAALTAYNFLQYTNISQEEKMLIKDGLLRYCELDTMAMVMLLEGLINLKENKN